MNANKRNFCCTILYFFFSWRLMRFNQINVAAALCLHGLTSPSAGTRHIGGANMISTKANSVLMLQLRFPHPVLQ